MRADKCDVYWRSHGCSLPRFHEGDSLSHECDPCPPNCTAPVDEDWRGGEDGRPWMSDCVGMCSEHCGDRPTRDDHQYGDDVNFFPKRTGMPS